MLAKIQTETLQEITGEPCTETAWMPSDVPALPYIVVLDDQDTGDSSDDKVNMIRHSYSLERYSEIQDTNDKLESFLRASGVHYTKGCSWLPAPDDMWQTLYTFETIERITE